MLAQIDKDRPLTGAGLPNLVQTCQAQDRSVHPSDHPCRSARHIRSFDEAAVGA